MRPMPFRPFRGLALAALLVAFHPAAAEENVLDLALGDPARREKMAPVTLDGVTDTARGEVVTPADLAARLDGVSLLLVGESHTDMDFHRVQARVIEELARRGRTVLIGLEMYPVGEQAALDRWSAEPTLGEADFLAQSRWYYNWGYHWEYYRSIFLFARQHGIRFFGLNVPRKVVQTARTQGLDALTPEQRQLLPATIDTASDEHRRLFRAYLGDDGMHGSLPEAMFEGMYRAQCTWDAAMAHHALSALARHGGEKGIMVVLVGSGHVAYGLGIERQAKLAFGGRVASLIPVPVEDVETWKPVTAARASYADFLWGVPATADPLFPVLGLSSPEREPGQPLSVIQVAKDSVAEAAGFAVGDTLLTLDGTPIDGKETFNRLMSEKRWGDTARFEVRRGEETKALVATFRRRAPKRPEPCASGSAAQEPVSPTTPPAPPMPPMRSMPKVEPTPTIPPAPPAPPATPAPVTPPGVEP